MALQRGITAFLLLAIFWHGIAVFTAHLKLKSKLAHVTALQLLFVALLFGAVLRQLGLVSVVEHFEGSQGPFGGGTLRDALVPADADKFANVEHFHADTNLSARGDFRFSMGRKL